RRLELGGIRHPALHVLEALGIRLLIRDRHDLSIRAGQRLDPLGQVQDRDLFTRADVEYLAEVLVRAHQVRQTAYDVLDMAEAASLAAVAEHRDGLLGYGLSHER